jgi:hypothetical protein
MSLDTSIGTASSESYASVAEADDYHSKRGNAAWAALSSDAKEQSLRKATQYLDTMYSWQGLRVRRPEEQALEWPRSYATYGYYSVPQDTIPTRVKFGCIELALKASAMDILPNIEPRITTSEQVGPIAVSYAEGQRSGGRVTFDAVDRLVSPYTLNSGGFGVSAVVRA